MNIKQIIASVVVITAGFFPAFSYADSWEDIASQEKARQVKTYLAAGKQAQIAKQQELDARKGVAGYFRTVEKVNKIEAGIDDIREKCRVMILNDVLLIGENEALRRSQYQAQFDPARRGQLNNAFAATMPGSTYDCIGENGRVVQGNQEYTIRNGVLIRYSERSQVNYTIVWGGATAMVSVSDGPEEKQKVTFVVDLMHPEKSYVNDVMFTNVSVNSSQQGGRKLNSNQPWEEARIGDLLPSNGNTLKSPSIQRPDNLDWELTFTKNDLIHAVDSFYRDNNAVSNMIDYAFQVMTEPTLRENVLMSYQKTLGGKL
jgi:hypothetical protein